MKQILQIVILQIVLFYLIKYLHYLHPIQTAFWQRPRDSVKSTDTIWFCSAPLGEKTLGGMMAKLSTKYYLNQRYTNHCIRVTSLQALDDRNIEGRHIVRISEHKSVDSVRTYARRLNNSRKRNISAVFANHLSTSYSACSNLTYNVNEETNCNSNTKVAKYTPPSSVESEKQNLVTMKETAKKNPVVDTIATNKNLVDFTCEGDVEDQTLSQVSANMLQWFASFNNYQNMQFTFNVYINNSHDHDLITTLVSSLNNNLSNTSIVNTDFV